MNMTARDIPSLVAGLSNTAGANAEALTRVISCVTSIVQGGDFLPTQFEVIRCEVLPIIKKLKSTHTDVGVRTASHWCEARIIEASGSGHGVLGSPHGHSISPHLMRPEPTRPEARLLALGATAATMDASASVPVNSDPAPARSETRLLASGATAATMDASASVSVDGDPAGAISADAAVCALEGKHAIAPAPEAPLPKTPRTEDAPRRTLKKKLVELRKRLADGKPAYTVYTNEVADGIVAAMPRTPAQLKRVKGVGPLTIERYGNEILRVTAEALGDDYASPPVAPSHTPGLNPEQLEAMELAVQEESLFLTGGAGTGKSHALRQIISALQSKWGRGRVFVTASTGIAACHIGGTTVHSFAGIGLGTEPVEVLYEKIHGKQAEKRWRAAAALVIDEVSMLDGRTFDKLEELARRLRPEQGDGHGQVLPFGGIQLILCGDFYQLPPVNIERGNSNVRFLFEANAWPRCFPRENCITLKQCFRQKDERAPPRLKPKGHLFRGLCSRSRTCVAQISSPFSTRCARRNFRSSRSRC